jgi:hypothetical protein
MMPNLNILEGIPVVNNYDPIVPGRYARWMDAIKEINIHLRDDLLDRMAVSLLEWSAETGYFGVRFVPRDSASRVRWVPCSISVKGPESAWKIIYSGKVDPDLEVVIETQKENFDLSCSPSSTTPQIVSEQSNEVIVWLSSQAKGWLVLSDVWYPGWRVSVDGELATLERADYLFRAVEVPAGTHQIKFAYRPLSFYIGAAISLISGLGLVGYYCIFKAKQCFRR